MKHESNFVILQIVRQPFEILKFWLKNDSALLFMGGIHLVVSDFIFVAGSAHLYRKRFRSIVWYLHILS